jgi:hypothetical protein
MPIATQRLDDSAQSPDIRRTLLDMAFGEPQMFG